MEITVGKAFRSIVAVVAGIAVLTAASFAIEALADPVMISLFGDKTRLAPSIFMYFYTAVSVAAGGYVTAWIAGRSPQGHATAMGVLQESLNVVGHGGAGASSALAKLDCGIGDDDSGRMAARHAAREAVKTDRFLFPRSRNGCCLRWASARGAR